MRSSNPYARSACQAIAVSMAITGPRRRRGESRPAAHSRSERLCPAQHASLVRPQSSPIRTGTGSSSRRENHCPCAERPSRRSAPSRRSRTTNNIAEGYEHEVFAIVAALGAAALIVGVAVGPDEARSEDQFTVGVSVWDVSTTPFAVLLVKGMRDAAEAANVNLIVSDVSDLRRAFDDEHERIYTFKMEGDRVNFLHWRVNAAVGSSMRCRAAAPARRTILPLRSRAIAPPISAARLARRRSRFTTVCSSSQARRARRGRDRGTDDERDRVTRSRRAGQSLGVRLSGERRCLMTS